MIAILPFIHTRQEIQRGEQVEPADERDALHYYCVQARQSRDLRS